MDKVKSRGVKKGEKRMWEAGRKATGRTRDKNISFRVTEEEKQLIYQILEEVGGNRTDALIKKLKK